MYDRESIKRYVETFFPASHILCIWRTLFLLSARYAAVADR